MTTCMRGLRIVYSDTFMPRKYYYNAAIITRWIFGYYRALSCPQRIFVVSLHPMVSLTFTSKDIQVILMSR